MESRAVIEFLIREQIVPQVIQDRIQNDCFSYAKVKQADALSALTNKIVEYEKWQQILPNSLNVSASVIICRGKVVKIHQF